MKNINSHFLQTSRKQSRTLSFFGKIHKYVNFGYVNKLTKHIAVHFGQAGCQMGTTTWEQYCKEHRIDLDGTLKSRRIRSVERFKTNTEKQPEEKKDDKDNKDSKDNGKEKAKETDKDKAQPSPEVFFQQLEKNDKFVPRSVMVDLEPNVIDAIKSSAFGALFNLNTLINGKEDAANNYARGHYTIGQAIAPQVMEALRKQVECCDHCQGFLFNFAVGGGTGSGADFF
ncbi:TuBulin, Alpha family member (tba-8) [Reticulomyxa filosa]|uniref:TuBulin, Alpha family member (Tba-8) n=1 Tax=Reticulomyxa filosa TaxID=46433 RepID=X6N9X9_RETFI|nr:TuBulin, Alpha family member (tba-8) [Reticulomyxa filosa]|eukprot:ETO23100.1 TuBulin, Alpha family member (tba-8) [Reticulomyxa filosa]